ncbi:MAG: hypothetical protein ACLR23_09800 [Clostridia bacterium]
MTSRSIKSQHKIPAGTERITTQNRNRLRGRVEKYEDGIVSTGSRRRSVPKMTDFPGIT